MYFFFNLSLTLYNKSVMLKFPFPWTLTAIHTLCSAMGSKVAEQGGVFKASEQVGPRETYTLFAFSVLYTINIAVSNLSLNLVSVPFHSVVRAMTPLFTIVLSTMFLRKRYPQATYVSLLPVVIGVGFTTLGEYDFTAWGLILTLLGVLLAALKTVITNIIMVGRLKLHPLDLLLRMSPLAFVQCILWSWWTGELERVREFGATQMDTHKFTLLAVNGAIAFGLNVVSFTANKKTSALTMTVAANVKQVLSIVLAVFMFNVPMNPMKVFGILLTLVGGAWYAKIELGEKSKKARLTTAPAK
ncbi:TPT-domain-containing protein [Atractiella rhizophila]|nr:TPT-domain-containing protein [Atractiella rhizophila]